jgi:hypothetical protein
VISNGTLTKYYSNTTRHQHLSEMAGSKRTRKTSNSFEFTSWWADATNRVRGFDALLTRRPSRRPSATTSSSSSNRKHKPHPQLGQDLRQHRLLPRPGRGRPTTRSRSSATRTLAGGSRRSSAPGVRPSSTKSSPRRTSAPTRRARSSRRLSATAPSGRPEPRSPRCSRRHERR